MAELLLELGSVFTQVVSWIGAIATTIVDTPILLLTTGFLVVGGTVGIFGRLLSKN